MNLTSEQRQKILNAVLVFDEERIRIAEEISQSVTLSIRLSSLQTKLTQARESLASLLVTPTPIMEELNGTDKIRADV